MTSGLPSSEVRLLRRCGGGPVGRGGLALGRRWAVRAQRIAGHGDRSEGRALDEDLGWAIGGGGQAGDVEHRDEVVGGRYREIEVGMLGEPENVTWALAQQRGRGIVESPIPIRRPIGTAPVDRSEEHTSELQ